MNLVTDAVELAVTQDALPAPSNPASMARFAPFACTATTARHRFRPFQRELDEEQAIAVGQQFARCGDADLHRGI